MENAIPLNKNKVKQTTTNDPERQLYYDIGFDLTQYSLKYDKCASISTYSDDLAQDEDAMTVFQLQKFVFFRLYPTNRCYDNYKWGAGREFGEYIIDLPTYLEIRQDFEDETIESYCDYCLNCMMGRRLDEANDDAAAGDDAEAGDDAVAGDDNAAAANDDAAAAAGDDAVVAEDDNVNNDDVSDDILETQCATCKNYQDKCAKADDNLAWEYDYFFGCEAFEGSDGTQKYLGPRCSSNGSIQIGVFNDDTCSQLASGINVGSFTGMTFSKNGLSSLTTSECISCKKSDATYIDSDDANDNGILDLCENLYYESAKCNKRIGSIYGDDNEFVEENKVCSYIENIAHNKYDEEGEIRLFTFHYSDLVYAAKVFQSSMTATQVKTLCGVIALCAVFALYAIYLSKKVKQAKDRGEIEWKDSGIGFARSGSMDDYIVQY